uniref:Uncharacterized protein n=1 Tax=Tetraselmis chuii TaxID=63592 RepID=A0A7S1SX12_9CHLO
MVIEVAQREGFGAFFKGAVPRMFWIAPLGAMNFAGYELAKNAMLDDKKGSGAEGGAQEVGPSSTGATTPSTTKAEAGERKAAATAERRGQRDGKEEEQDGRGGGGVSTAPFRAISEHSTDSSSPVHYDNKYGIADAALSEQWEPEKTEGNGRVVVGPPPPKG